VVGRSAKSPRCTSAKYAICRGQNIRTTVVIELYRVRFRDCGMAEKVALLPSKAPFSERLEEAAGASL